MVFTNIQILRAIAAINVVIAHSVYFAISNNFNSYFAFFFKDWGTNGVDIFFVISGFVIYYIYKKKNRSGFDFILRRMKRIIPLYWFYSLVLFIFFLLFPILFNKFSTDFNHLFLSLFFLSGIFFNKLPVYPLGWTLEIEFFYYLIFGLFIILTGKKKYFLFFIMLFIILSSWKINSIFIEFLFGILIGIIFFSNNKKLKYIISKFSSMILLAGIISLFLSLFISLNYNRIVLYGIPSFFIVLAAVFLKQNSNKILIFLGNASYSIYLTHFLILGIFFKLAKFLIPNFDPTILFLFSIIICLLIGSALYLIIEKRIIKYLRQF
jgi:peptidoglycan/LPS O-acetylase OafA/YrhL